MRYHSTRNKKLNFSFKEVFQRGLAPDGGLFIPSEIPKYNANDLEKLKKLSYVDLASEILFNFCKPDFDKDTLNSLISKSYKSFKSKDVVTLKKLSNLNFLELYHGPTLAFKDIAMQVIGNLFEQSDILKEETLNIIVATSGDTGSAAISALNDRKNVNLFVLHPHNKISNMQRKIMTTIGSKNIFNIAVEGTFDDCQKIVKEMFSDEVFRKKIKMSGVNSINWARIICQIVYYFFVALKNSNEKFNFSVPTGNFGDIYAGYMAKKMGLPINKLIVATNENDILQRVINTGNYKPSKVKSSLSPSMDIQVASNFERLLFYILDNNDKKLSELMRSLKDKGSFQLEDTMVKKIKEDFCAEKISDQETLKIIREFDQEHNFIIDPHTATGIGAAKKIQNSSKTIVLATAHPYKFLETVKEATGKSISSPTQLKSLKNKEKFDVIENNISKIKSYIIERAI